MQLQIGELRPPVPHSGQIECINIMNSMFVCASTRVLHYTLTGSYLANYS